MKDVLCQTALGCVGPSWTGQPSLILSILQTRPGPVWPCPTSHLHRQAAQPLSHHLCCPTPHFYLARPRTPGSQGRPCQTMSGRVGNVRAVPCQHRPLRRVGLTLENPCSHDHVDAWIPNRATHRHTLTRGTSPSRVPKSNDKLKIAFWYEFI